MQVGKFWLITVDTIKGPWHVASLDDGKGRDMGHGLGRAGSWYIVNKDNGKSKRIGPVRMNGRNYCDEARAEAKRRNVALGYAQE